MLILANSGFAILPFGDVQDIFGTKTGLYGVLKVPKRRRRNQRRAPTRWRRSPGKHGQPAADGPLSGFCGP